MKFTPVILTIAIPTYNRAVQLQKQLGRLMPQLTASVRLCVYDNASSDNTGEVVAKYPSVSYFRATTNCGATRNIFRCFEECSTEWVWVLSDDDFITHSAVSDLLAILDRESADFIHTSSWMKSYSDSVVVTDLPSLFQQSSVDSLWWITGGIYRINSFRPLFYIYNEAMSTWGAHLIMILTLLESQRGKARLIPINLTLHPTKSATWSTGSFLLRSSSIPEYLECPQNQRLVAEQIYYLLFNSFMLMALRETNGTQQIRKWQRIYFQARQNFKAYGVRSYIAKNWYRAGHRNASLKMFRQNIMLKLLAWCPVRLFHAIAGRLPLSKDVRENHYSQRNKYAAST